MTTVLSRTARLVGVFSGASAVGAVALTGCVSSSAQPSGSSEAVVVAPGSLIALTTTSGTSVQVPASTPTVLFFFTGECGTSADGARNMAQAQHQAGGAGQFLGVDMDPSRRLSLVGRGPECGPIFPHRAASPCISVQRESLALLGFPHG